MYKWNNSILCTTGMIILQFIVRRTNDPKGDNCTVRQSNKDKCARGDVDAPAHGRSCLGSEALKDEMLSLLELTPV